MGIKTKIEYADSSINPIMGCTGCALRKGHCYAASLCARYAGRKGWPKSFDEPEHFPGRLEKAIRWPDLTGTMRSGKPTGLDGLPRHIFVNDMSDGFCPDVDLDEWLPPQLLGQMAASPHIWLLLTKWPDRMCEFFERYRIVPDNFYLGVSIENQRAADERREYLRQCPAAVKFVSYEPALSAVDWTGWEFVSQIISGGESGPGARPSHPDWHRVTRDFCQEHSIAYFFKQWGAWYPTARDGCWCQGDKVPGVPNRWLTLEGEWCTDLGPLGMAAIARIGKKAAGRLLDGEEWNAIPKRGGD